MTHYERIKEMSVEELAALLYSVHAEATRLTLQGISEKYHITLNQIELSPTFGAIPFLQLLKSEVPENGEVH